MKVRIKKYWEIDFSSRFDCISIGGNIIKAKSPEKAITKFYKQNNKYYLKSGCVVKKVKPLEIEVVEELENYEQ